jgi:hypothetical protein
MTDPEKIAFKNRLKQFGVDLIGQRMSAAKQAMEQAQEAANSEEKSSAGDKYETGRAMGHLQKDMHARQLAESVKELAAFQAVPTEPLCQEGRTGAVLLADGVLQADAALHADSALQAERVASRQAYNIAFFIGAGLGKQAIDGQTVLFLSPQAPLAKLLEKKKTGDSIVFNQRTLIVRDVF